MFSFFDSLLTKAIRKAQLTFESGIEVQKRLWKELNNKDRYRKGYDTNGLFRPLDENFPNYPANSILGTHFVSAEGPRLNNIIHFFRNTLFNKKNPIKHVVVLVKQVAEDITPADCFDYCIEAGKKELVYNNGQSICKLNVIHEKESQARKVQYGYDEKGRLILQHDIIQSQVKVRDNKEQETLNATIIPIADGCHFNLRKENDEFLDHFWRILKLSNNENVAVHCSVGLGRTGHFILMLEILRHYQEIFASDNPSVIASNIHKILKRIRENCPLLVFGDAQFSQAIVNADVLYQYGLKKGYVKVDKPQPVKSYEPNKEVSDILGGRSIFLR